MKKIFLVILILSLVVFSRKDVRAADYANQLEAGVVISFGGHKFMKIDNPSSQDSYWVMVDNYCASNLHCSSGNTHVWDLANSNNWTRPAQSIISELDYFYSEFSEQEKSFIVGKDWDMTAEDNTSCELTGAVGTDLDNCTWLGKVNLISYSEWNLIKSNFYDLRGSYLTNSFWTRTPNSGVFNQVWTIDVTGNLVTSDVGDDYFVLPSLHFSSDLLYEGGDGTYASPYLVKFLNDHQFQQDLDSVSATVSNSRPSFRALTAGSNSGSSVLTIKTDNYTNSKQVQGGDFLVLNGNSYQVAHVSGFTEDQIPLQSPLLSGDNNVDSIVTSKILTDINVNFKTVSALTDGSFRVLVPANNDDSLSADEIPDAGYFDFGNSEVMCVDSGSYVFSNSAVANAIIVEGQNYHEYRCDYTGVGNINDEIDLTIANIINPARKGTNSIADLDTYRVLVEHLDSEGKVVDSSFIQLGFNEAIRLKAYISPQLSFSMSGISSGRQVCGTDTNVATTATKVDFGELDVAHFTNAAHKFDVATNIEGGYSVTASQTDQMGKNGRACSGDGTGIQYCIPDPVGSSVDGSGFSWNDPTVKGFGYSIGNLSGEVDSPISSSRYRSFADRSENDLPEVIFSNDDITDGDSANVCYRIVPPANIESGNYENGVIYTVTALF